MVFAMSKPFLALISALLFLSCGLLAQSAASGAKEQKPAEQKAAEQVPTISADRGDCSAAFTVLDAKGKPVYQASIHTLVRWGLAHKTDLTVSTNYYGKAEFTHLPNYSKKPIVFDVSAGDKKRTVLFDPGNQCKADFTVELR